MEYENMKQRIFGMEHENMEHATWNRENRWEFIQDSHREAERQRACGGRKGRCGWSASSQTAQAYGK